MLAAFAELVRDGGADADIGCRSGRVTAHLHALGLTVSGIDLSPRMISLARQHYPELTFDEGSMEDLVLADESLSGLVAWYSIIHLPPDRVAGVLAEFVRILGPKGRALLAFFGAEADVVAPFDHKVTTAYRWAPERLAELMETAGCTVTARLVREPVPGERFPQAYLLVTKDRQFA